MASVTVFVDDAVQGHLPGVCAKDGVATADSLRLSQEVGNRAGLGVAWLLFFAGPPGWLALVFISLSRSGRIESLQVTLPMSEPAYRRRRAAQRLRDRAALVAVLTAAVSLLLLVSSSGGGTLARFGALAVAAVFVGGMVGFVIGALRFSREEIDISLDASRRWVTLGDVHPQFEEACRAHEARQTHRT